MPLRKSLSLAGPVACSACLAVGYALAQQWGGCVVSLLTLPAWLLARQKPDALPPSVSLVFCVVIAAGGLLTGAAPLFMISGAALALASWDLVLLVHSLAGSSGSSAAALSLFEQRHVQYLALALGASLLVAVAGRLLRVQLPFVAMAVLAIIILLSLDRIFRTLTGVK